MNVTLFHRIFRDLYIRYSVHDIEPLVWLLGIEPLVWLLGIEPVFNHPLREVGNSEDL